MGMHAFYHGSVTWDKLIKCNVSKNMNTFSHMNVLRNLSQCIALFPLLQT